MSLGTRAPGEGTAVLVEINGDIVVGTQLFPTSRRQPTQTALARFTSTGALDNSFGSHGTIYTNGPGCSALAELSTGELLVVLRGFSQTGTQVGNATVHYVGTGGSGIQAIVQGLAAEANGDIVAVGGQTTFSQTGVTIVNGLAQLKLQNGSLFSTRVSATEEL